MDTTNPEFFHAGRALPFSERVLRAPRVSTIVCPTGRRRYELLLDGRPVYVGSKCSWPMGSAGRAAVHAALAAYFTP